jgi:hypothetical protein
MLPPAWMSALDQAKVSARFAAESLAASNEGAARAAVDAALTGLQKLISEQSVYIEIRRIKAVFHQIARAAGDSSADFAKAVDQLDTSPPSPLSPETKSIRSAVECMDQIGRSLRALTLSAVDLIRMVFVSLDQAMRRANVPEPAAWATARTATDEFSSRVERMSTGMLSAAAEFARETESLLATWSSAILQQSAAEPVKKALTSSDFLGAVAAVLRDERMDSREESAVSPVNATSARAAVLVTPEPSPAAQPLSSPFAGDIEMLEQVESLKTRNFRQWLFAKALQWVFASAALAVVGYLIFADKFIGTDADLTTAFMWGFTTDIGVDALIAAAKPKAVG